jgi:chorismate mutase
VRVAAQRPVHPQRLANVYRELIELAKAVQRAHPTEKATAPLEALRDAITRIDQQLVHEVDRPHTASREQWQTVIDDTITLAGVDATMRVKLATALADRPPPFEKGD